MTRLISVTLFLFILSSCYGETSAPDQKLKIVSASIVEFKENYGKEEGDATHEALNICFDKELTKEDFNCLFGPRCSHHIKFKFKFSNGEERKWWNYESLGNLDFDHLTAPKDWKQRCFNIYKEPHCYKGYTRFNDCSTYKVFNKGQVSDLVIEYYWQNKHVKLGEGKPMLVDTFKQDSL
ncbi:hypothetical protein ABMA79_05975 [Halobacteriovorax sp. HFRX-2_2]|uniref:hypothetical protein n=1 Tax=unclassified Halobacteriovorax TaxID=2639665 RepID=UPI0037160266